MSKLAYEAGEVIRIQRLVKLGSMNRAASMIILG